MIKIALELFKYVAKESASESNNMIKINIHCKFNFLNNNPTLHNSAYSH